MLCLTHWSWQIQRCARAISHYTTVWCLVTPSTVVCSGFTATCSLLNHFTAATDWTLLWFDLQVLMMEPSWSRQIQFGMQGFCSFSLPHRKPTPGRKRLTVHSCRRWKHMTILKTVINVIIVIIVIIYIIDVIVLIFVYWCYCNYWYYCNYCNYWTYLIYLGWLDSIGSRIVYELDHRNPILYVIPIQSILGKLPVVPVGDTGTIPHHLRSHFSGAPGDRRPGSGDGCRMWFVNSWALGWSRDM